MFSAVAVTGQIRPRGVVSDVLEEGAWGGNCQLGCGLVCVRPYRRGGLQICRHLGNAVVSNVGIGRRGGGFTCIGA